MAELAILAKESAANFAKDGHSLFTQAQGISRVDVLEITKLGDKEGPNTIATRSLGDQNLLLVDEGHRGLSGKNAKSEENAWFKNRAMLCDKGFTFEYSATFDQAVSGTGHEDDYARTVIFDYLILDIEKIKQELEKNKQYLLKFGEIKACRFDTHLFQPLFHVRKGGKITILPVALNDSEFQFVIDLKDWSEKNALQLQKDGVELFLLRNLSRGKGVGFFEAGGFHPDFILWMMVNRKQYISFIEPHGLLHEGPGSEKVLFHKRIKEIETRLGNPDVILNSFILSWTEHPQLRWGIPREELEKNHILFMTDDRDDYIDKLFAKFQGTFE